MKIACRQRGSDVRTLYESLNQRRRPEDVAQHILELLDGRLDRQEKKLLAYVARGSLKQRLFGYTSMLQEFARPVGMQRQIAMAEELFTSAYTMNPDECDDPDAVERFLRHIEPEIRKSFGRNDFMADRLNHKERKSVGLDVSRRRYNKLFRHLTRMEVKLHRLIREITKREFQMIAKSGLASTIPREDFSSDLNTACFIAYYTAWSNQRSEFTVTGQQRPYDEVADMLFQRCRKGKATNWWAIAHVYPSQDVLERLADRQKGELLGRWFGILQEIATMLEDVWRVSDINRATMVVKRGNDSSTWNNTAGAWNKARDNWIALLYTMGLGGILEGMCPGKVLRLMAADVVAWHLSLGHTLSPETGVWNELPLPWDVLTGRETCTKHKVEDSCRRHGVDPGKSGWTGPKSTGTVHAFQPTPELVHGVTVGNPFLATLLKKQEFFSGKVYKPLQVDEQTGTMEEAPG